MTPLIPNLSEYKAQEMSVMSNKCLVNILLLSLNLIATHAFADNCQTLDQQIATALINANDSSNYGDHPDEDKLTIANTQIDTIVQSFKNDSSTITCPFSQAQKQGLQFLTSADGSFRAFSWDIGTGGTMHFFNQYIQFVDDKGYSQIKGGEGGLVTSLFTTKLHDKPLYLLATTGIGSSKITTEVLNLYQIQDESLIEPKIIKTKQGLTNQLTVDYNFFSVVDRPERPVKLFEFDKKSKTIRFPVVVEDKEFMNGKVTNRFIRYGFDGNYFIRK